MRSGLLHILTYGTHPDVVVGGEYTILRSSIFLHTKLAVVLRHALVAYPSRTWDECRGQFRRASHFLAASVWVLYYP